MAGIGLLAISVQVGTPIRAQSLMVLPVNVQMGPGQLAATLTVVNKGTSETAIQIRTYAWNQPGGEDQLTASDAVMVSPPLASIAPGASQMVRLVLRKSPEGREATYRIVLDQIPPPAEPGVVRVVLRLSIPLFAQPPTRTSAHVVFHVEQETGQMFLVATNDGAHHEAVRDISLSSSDGRRFTLGAGASPYILAGVTRRWQIAAQDSIAVPYQTLQLTARRDAGAVEQQVHIVTVP